jgi:7-cyano-7-deazaguanine synthase
MNTKAIVLFSGGQDSATCLAQALEDYPNAVEAITFDYGQRHHIEIIQAQKIAKMANVPLKVIDLSLISQLTQSALTHTNIIIEHKSGDLPSTFVPGRNHLFLSVAAIMAYQKNCTHIYTGVCQTDYSGYPDCREDFIKSLEFTLNLAMSRPIQIHTPLMHLTKAETIWLMKKLGKLEWYKETHTCYEGVRPACGQCPACQLRLKGFKEAEISDPLEYVKPTALPL